MFILCHLDKPTAQLSFITPSTSNNTFHEDSTVRLLCNTSDSNPGVEEIIWYVGSTILNKKTDSHLGEHFDILKMSTYMHMIAGHGSTDVLDC